MRGVTIFAHGDATFDGTNEEAKIAADAVGLVNKGDAVGLGGLGGGGLGNKGCQRSDVTVDDWSAWWVDALV